MTLLPLLQSPERDRNKAKKKQKSQVGNISNSWDAKYDMVNPTSLFHEQDFKYKNLITNLETNTDSNHIPPNHLNKSNTTSINPKD